MATWYRRLFRSLPIVIVVFGALMLLVWPLVSIQLRLSRNGAIVSRLVQSLHARYPGASFRGNTSYEREAIYITIMDGLKAVNRQDLEQWLRAQKSEQRIVPTILLRLSPDADDWDMII